MQPKNPLNAQGIDVSAWQGVIDWQQVRAAGYSFSIVKITEGSTIQDRMRVKNLAGAKSAGILIGGYHFLHAQTPQEAVQEADWFLSSHNPADMDLPPVIDIEVPYTNKIAIRSWIDHVEQATGIKPMVYANAQYLDMYLNDDYFRDCPLWYAMYKNDHPADRNGWNHWAFFQHSESGTVPGIAGPVDLNEYEGSVEELIEALKPAPKAMMSVEDADDIIEVMKGLHAAGIGPEKVHKLANSCRVASGRPEE